jgi:hypothetical protein
MESVSLYPQTLGRNRKSLLRLCNLKRGTPVPEMPRVKNISSLLRELFMTSHDNSENGCMNICSESQTSVFSCSFLQSYIVHKPLAWDSL